jgi:hypothetical protein
VVDTTLQPGEQRVLQQSGSPGFTISYWRKVYKGEDLVANETFTTHYKPEDEILEVGPKPPPKAPKPTGSTQTPGTTGGGNSGTTTGGGPSTGGGTSTGGKDQSPGGQDQPPAGTTKAAATK